MTAAEQHEEIERKFALGPDDEVPDPVDWPGVVTAAQPQRFALDALYYDTEDLRLVTAGVTLRRRTGGSDDGWHLKVPGDGEGRIEHALPLGAAEEGPPGEFVQQVAQWTGDAPLRPICRVRTTRVERRLDGPAGAVASLCDDRVATHNLLDPRLDQRWHEFEVELTGDGSLDFLDAVTAHLTGLGVPQVSIASKLRTALTPAGAGD